MGFEFGDRLWVVLLLCLGGVLILTVGSVAAVDSGTDGVTISEEIESTAGEQTIVVQLTERSDMAVQSTDTSDQPAAMKSHAATTQESVREFVKESQHVSIERQLWIVNAVVLNIDTTEVPLSTFEQFDHVERIHEDYEISAAGAATPQPASSAETTTTQPPSTVSPDSTAVATSNDKVTRAIEHINVPDVWDEYDTRGEGINVAVVDTGVNPDHPDIDITEDNWTCEIDCDGNPDGPHDNFGHGTHVSGTVVGGDANDENLRIGVAPDATLMHAKALNDDGFGSFSSWSASLQWAIENDADIVSASLSTEEIDDAYVDGVRNAQASGVPVIAAIGNEEEGTSGSPANVYDAIAVGSSTLEPNFPGGGSFGIEDDGVSDFSGGTVIEREEWNDPPEEWPASYTTPDIVAPGEIIWSADTNLDEVSHDEIETTELRRIQGTSMATPHVAGVAALMQAATEDSLEPVEIRETLQDTAGDLGVAETRQGAGLIDASAAVDEVAETTTGSVSIDDQATNSATITSDTLTEPAAAVDVDTDSETTVVVTYKDAEGDTIVAGMTDASEATDGSVIVELDSGGPGNSTAHLIADEDAADLTVGDPLGDVAQDVIDSDSATVFKGTVSFDAQSFDDEPDELTLNSTELEGDDDALYAVNLHPTDDSNELIADEFVGTTQILAADGERSGVPITLQDQAGDSVTIQGTDEYVAMIHLVDEEAVDGPVDEGEIFTPGAFDSLQHTSSAGVIASGVSDNGTVSAPEIEDEFRQSLANRDVSDAAIDAMIAKADERRGGEEIATAADLNSRGVISEVINGLVFADDDEDLGYGRSDVGNLINEFVVG